MYAYCKRSKTGGVEGLGTRLVIKKIVSFPDCVDHFQCRHVTGDSLAVYTYYLARNSRILVISQHGLSSEGLGMCLHV